MCQKSNAVFSNYTKVKKENFKFSKKKNLKWFNSSKNFKRGFCSNCGSSLFFQSRLSNGEIAISSGSLDSKVPVKGHIFYKDKKSNAAKFLSDLGNPYHEVLIDLDGTKSIEFGAIGVPETYLINNKIIVKKYIGPLDQSKFKEIIEIIKNEKN